MAETDRIAALEARLAAAEARIAGLEAARGLPLLPSPPWTPPPACPVCDQGPLGYVCGRPDCPTRATVNGYSPMVITRFLDGTLTPTVAEEPSDGA